MAAWCLFVAAWCLKGVMTQQPVDPQYTTLLQRPDVLGSRKRPETHKPSHLQTECESAESCCKAFIICLFYSGLCWVFIAARVVLWLGWGGSSLQWHLSLRSTGSTVPIACGAAQIRDWTCAGCHGGRTLNHWTIWEPSSVPWWWQESERTVSASTWVLSLYDNMSSTMTVDQKCSWGGEYPQKRLERAFQAPQPCHLVEHNCPICTWPKGFPIRWVLAIHCSILGWRIPRTEDDSPWGCKEFGTTERLTL